MVKFVDLEPDKNPGNTSNIRGLRSTVRPDSTAPRSNVAPSKIAPVTYLPGARVDQVEEARDSEPLTSDEVEDALVRALARRSLSESEILEQAIKRYGLEPAEANDILDHLRDLGYVNDRALAEQLRHSLSDRKGQSRSIVARTMTSRGIERDLINEVLDDIADEAELEQATQIAIKRASTLSRFDHETAERRLVGYLARRGYPGHIVRAAVAAALSPGRSGVAFR